MFLPRSSLLTALLLTIPLVSLAAKPQPGGSRSGFRMFAAAVRTFEVNQVQCEVISRGEICSVTSSGGGGIWPRGSANFYIFASGLQVAGVIGPDGGPWAGHTTGALFFDPRFGLSSGQQVAPIYNTAEAADRAFIEGGSDRFALAAQVPLGDASEILYHPTLRGRTSASQGDVWWLSWEGNPALSSNRPHPLGLLVEQRGLGWNFPRGNEDIIYFVFTFYNITSLDPAAYSAVRPGMREILIEQANELHRSNNERLPAGSDLPTGGWTIENMYVSFAADMDVGDAVDDYSSVNVPMALGYTYSSAFDRPGGWTFDPVIFSSPFFSGSGFAGVKYLKSPEVNGEQVGLTLFSSFIGFGAPPGAPTDPESVEQLYRYQRGVMDPGLGDGNCNTGDPQVTHVCYMNNVAPADMRFFQSSGPVTLGAGEAGSIAVAYIFAAPVEVGGCSPPCHVSPGDPTVLLDPATADAGNTADSMAGYLGFAGDLNGNTKVDQDEILTVPGSLLGKARVAQVVFDNQFLLPFAPVSPEFFLIPGDNQVTVMWRPSASEATADPFFQLASQASTGGAPNPLYDPNYRQFDVEGYRIYRGRVDAQNSLRLIAQFDYTGTVFQDFAGQVNPTGSCAPELGITGGCPVVFDPIQPGLARTTHVSIPLVGPIIQVQLGDRVALATNQALVLSADTTVSGKAVSGCFPASCPDLGDTGVPFVFVDRNVRNSFRYFYSVVAFDVNSFQSGPATLESPRVTKAVTPVRPASNFENTAALDAAVYGRDLKHTDLTQPVIDPNTGAFSKKMPAPNGWNLALSAFVQQVIAAPGAISVSLDSLTLGSAYAPVVPVSYWTTVTTAAGSTVLQIPITQDQFNSEQQFSTSFDAIVIDDALAARYGGSSQYTLAGQLDAALPGNYYTSAFGRGCANAAPGFSFANTPQAGCDYNGARWFDGPSPAANETVAHPNGCSAQNNTLNSVTCYSNAGSLTGVVNIFEQKSYQTTPNVWRNVEGILGGAVRAADYNVYWGAGGLIDSVIDISSNVEVAFDANRVGSSWGILNPSAAAAAGSYDGRTELSITDFGCVQPFKNLTAAAGELGCAAGTTYTLSNTAVPGSIVHWSGPTDNARVACTAAVPVPAGCGSIAPNAGFAMYMPGHLFLFELTGGQLPAAGTVWSMRDYSGSIRGGGNSCAICLAGADGPYAYVPRTSTMAATGAEVRFTYLVANRVNPPTGADLARVHTVPDPYYVTSEFENTTDLKQIKFVNLPQDAVIRIYSSSGVLLRLLEHHSRTFGGELSWDVRNRNNQVIASGVYFYHIEAGNARRVGRFTVVNWAN
jgi:hypothetical protein